MTMEPPVPPDESDCCNSGCNPCILDVYEAQLKKYNEYCKNVQNSNIQIVNSISATSYTVFKIIEKKQTSPTSYLLRFKYADSKDKTPSCFKYQPGQYILMKSSDHDGEFTRAYTPIPVEEENLGFTILVRIYSEGRMSKLLERLQVGDDTSWRGPYAQGTGIAPVFAVINEIIHNEDCESFIKLFFCCRNDEEILLRDHLYELSSYWNFSYEIFLSNCDNLIRKYNETIHESKLSSSDFSRFINGKIGQLQAMICGSEKFNENIKNEIEEFGIESSHIYLF